jgi:hypothetical protein
MSKYIDLSPSPIALIESLRNIGYSMETAIADVVDNSITANATQIHIRFSWNSGNPWLAIVDNGYGMTKSELINAMRFGSMNPLEIRTPNDLGRFGLGMKTASLSQCQHLYVLSQKDGQVSCCEWDLKLIAKTDNPKWTLGVLDLEAIRQRTNLNLIYRELFNHNQNQCGTIVLWENLDKATEQSTLLEQEQYFSNVVYGARKHLELVFHRFLSPEVGHKKVEILMNGDDLKGFNPFNPRNLATQELEKQHIILDGEKIVVQPYVLPHHNKISRQEYEEYAGDGGYLHNQGFYVYRNRRLIIKGTWFRLIKKEELNKLIRIRVDIPNTLDHLWKIDVKKSHAVPSEAIKNELKRVIGKIEGVGRRVYQQRGARLSSNLKDPVWVRKAVGGMIVYQINRDHPLVTDLLRKVPSEQRGYFNQVLTMFENSFPVDLFFNDIASKPERVERPEFAEEALEMLLEVFIEMWAVQEKTNEEIVKELLLVDPFASNKNLTEKLMKRKGYIHE